MHNKFTTFIAHHNLLSKDTKVVVGVSGGADSVALLHLLHMCGYTCIVAHCNFNLREDESDRDEQFVAELAKRWNLPFESISFDTEKTAAERKISIEMAARELRYEWFESLRKKHHAEAIAVGHHRDDNVETVLLNLIRGTGIRGLSGILPKNGHIVRPLLAISREEIDSYLKAHNLEHITDSTNAENYYLRNKIRNELIPMLSQFNPSVREAIERTAENLHQVEEIYFAEIGKQRQRLLKQSDNIFTININELKQHPQSITILYELLHPFGFNTSTCQSITESLSGISGKRFYSNEYQLLKDRDVLIISKQTATSGDRFMITEQENTISSPFVMTIESIEKTDFQLSNNKNCAQLDASGISFPLTLRRWQQGDIFQPLGLNGKKKVSDLFTDLKYSVLQKEEAWILCSNDRIIWVVGERIDHRYRVTEKTGKILVLTIK